MEKIRDDTDNYSYISQFDDNDDTKNIIIGNTMQTFINLPANSRVYISYKEKVYGEGFLSLRKI